MKSWLWSVLLLQIFSNLASANSPVVKVLNGSYSGVFLPQFNQDLFLGIPYAQNTGGLNRFLIPQALNKTWEDVRPAIQYGNACPDNYPQSDAAYGMSENCLSINIIKPAGPQAYGKLPIVLWIHGGRSVGFHLKSVTLYIIPGRFMLTSLS